MCQDKIKQLVRHARQCNKLAIRAKANSMPAVKIELLIAIRQQYMDIAKGYKRTIV